MFVKKHLFGLVFLLVATSAFAQAPVKQSGNVTPNQVPWWITSGVIGGGVSAADSPVTSFGVTNNGGNGICVNSARITAAGRNTLCLGAQTAGPATITLQNYGTASPQALDFILNGTTYQFPGSGSGTVVGPSTSVVGDLAVWNNTNGTLLKDVPFATVCPGCITSQPYFNYVTLPPYNAKCDGVTNDSPAFQAAINALPSTGGVINVPPNAFCLLGVVLDFKGKNNVRLQGAGGFGGGGQTPSVLAYLGTTRGFDFRDTSGGTIDGVTIVAVNPAFNTGYIIDAGSVTPPGVSQNFTLSNSTVSNRIDLGVLAGCLDLNRAIIATVDRVAFVGCSPSIHGNSVSGASNVISILRSTFTGYNNYAIVECGDSWLLQNNTFEASQIGTIAIFANTVALFCRGIKFDTNWVGDETAASGSPWIALTARGGTISGGTMGSGFGSTAISFTGGSGYVVEGIELSGFGTAIQCLSSPSGGRVNGNTFSSVTTPVGTGCVNFDRSNNTPDISPANGTTSIASGACGAGANGTITAGSTNASGFLQIGAAATTSCVVTFGPTTLEFPVYSCQLMPANAAAAAVGTTQAQAAASTSGFTITGAALANAQYTYICKISG